MKLIAILLLTPVFAWASCTVVQVSPTHRDVSCDGNVAVRNPQPTTITTTVMVGRPRPEEQRGYYPSRVTGVVSGGEYVQPRQSYGWSAGGAGREYYSDRKWR